MLSACSWLVRGMYLRPPAWLAWARDKEKKNVKHMRSSRTAQKHREEEVEELYRVAEMKNSASHRMNTGAVMSLHSITEYGVRSTYRYHKLHLGLLAPIPFP